MKAVVIEEYGGIEQLKEKELPKPEIGEHQVLVEIYATSINPIDWKVREGYLKEGLPFQFPIILGWDAAGVITKTGSKVTDFKIGDEVYARPATTERGTYAEYVVVDDHLLAQKPNNLDFKEAASVPLTALTAWQCLVDFSHIKEGDKVLIHAGSGGVGSFAIQIAKHFGAYVASTASEKNEALLKELGVDEFINYKEQKFEEILHDYDIIVDTLGGDILDKSFQVLKDGGKLVSIAGNPDKEKATARNIETSFLWLEPNGEQLDKLRKLIEAGKVKPIVGHELPFSEEGIKKAHQLSETHHAQGKIVIYMK
ncbi:2-desacetyl-2-hydroxyethyl bacteriochlorophyllide A dehydrogenase [Salinibacillus kushneri]|uniref:2-desacetyl-2-hydroxyethyl bacteriochlorophyllide A dehydrogenase n=1 Tax=Salinibacillus kushneri TaxID=237682 RepID=A0A1I0ERC6_9BACI|nr:NADP-dependent oxidoreductase [Salinibacillus kushneri]SET47900.1 2-desacetyl-2-hydroxyethyl bacteriochlorophyllide A dehydrogenase [Salinibacillus kushneri]